MVFCAHAEKYLWVCISCMYFHLPRTKAVPRLHHPCLRLASASHFSHAKFAQAPPLYPALQAGNMQVCFTKTTRNSVLLSLLRGKHEAKEERRKSEGRAIKSRQPPSFRLKAFYSFFSASSKSALMSSTFSMPTDRRSMFGYTPEAILASSGSCSCVVLAG